MPLRVFQDEICIWNHSPPQCECASFNLLNVWTNQLRKEESAPFLSCLVAWDGTPHLMVSCPWSEIYINGCPGSQVSELELNYTTGFPGSPACRQQIMGVFSLHNYISQYLIINIFIPYWFCFSKEPLLIHWQMESAYIPLSAYCAFGNKYLTLDSDLGATIHLWYRPIVLYFCV